MKFVNEKTTETFWVKETNDYEVVCFGENGKRAYGLQLDGVLVTFLNDDQAKMLEGMFKNSKLEDFFNSIGIGDKFLNCQPKAATKDDYERPTGDIF